MTRPICLRVNHLQPEITYRNWKSILHTQPYELVINQHSAVIAAIGPDSIEGRKIAGCRYHSRCSSSLCPFCCMTAASRKAKNLNLAAVMLPESRRLHFPTFVAADVPLKSLNTACKALMTAARSTMRTLGVADYALSQETSIASESYHAHVHSLTSTPKSGRGYLPSGAWEETWLSYLPTDLHPNRSAVFVEPVESIGAVSQYVCKSPFKDVTSDATIQRIVNALFETKGLRRFETSGRLKFELRSNRSLLALPTAA
jgi:hypothetical protein